MRCGGGDCCGAGGGVLACTLTLFRDSDADTIRGLCIDAGSVGTIPGGFRFGMCVGSSTVISCPMMLPRPLRCLSRLGYLLLILGCMAMPGGEEAGLPVFLRLADGADSEAPESDDLEAAGIATPSVGRRLASGENELRLRTPLRGRKLLGGGLAVGERGGFLFGGGISCGASLPLRC